MDLQRGFVFLSLVLSFMIIETTAYRERQLLLLQPPQETAIDTANAVVTVQDRGLKTRRPEHKNAYATMMYMGTPRDYEFYVATRVLIRSLRSLHVEADLVVIASLDVPLRWVQTLEEEDGAKVVRVENVDIHTGDRPTSTVDSSLL